MLLSFHISLKFYCYLSPIINFNRNLKFNFLLFIKILFFLCHILNQIIQFKLFYVYLLHQILSTIIISRKTINDIFHTYSTLTDLCSRSLNNYKHFIIHSRVSFIELQILPSQETKYLHIVQFSRYPIALSLVKVDTIPRD